MEFLNFILFSFGTSFFVLSFSLYMFRLFKPWCSCEVCRTYVSSGWTLKYNNLCDWYTNLLQKSPSGTIHIHVLNNIITSNPQNVEHILKTKFDNYPKGKQFSTILGDLLGHGIFNVDGEKWKFQRKMASLELGSLSTRSYALKVVTSEITTRLIPLLSSIGEKNVAIDLQDVFRRFSFDNICKFSFGVDPGCLELSLPVSDFAVAFDIASKLSAQRAMAASPLVWKIKRLFNLGSEKKLKEAINKVNDFAEEVIRKKRELGFSMQDDFLSRFMGSVSDKYLRDIVISFMLAGRDTVASTLTSFFWVLAQHPKIVSAIRDESNRILGQNEELTSYEQMRDLHYLQAALYESMRLYPAVQFDSKFCQQNDVLPDGTFVAKGTRVTYHPYAMGRMESIWGPDCLEFKPERWLENGLFRPENPYKYPVFQAGPRVCLGKEMALVEMKTVVVSLLRRFDIQPVAPTSTLRFGPGLTATVRGGFPVTIRERTLL